MNIPPEVQVKAALTTNRGRVSLVGPGKVERVDLSPYRSGRREQELVFELARDLTKEYASSASCEAPPHVLFPQLVQIVQRFLRDVVRPIKCTPSFSRTMKSAGSRAPGRYGGRESRIRDQRSSRTPRRYRACRGIETKGFDELAEIKAAAAQRWVAAVNAEGSFGRWEYAMARSVPAVRTILDGVAGAVKR